MTQTNVRTQIALLKSLSVLAGIVAFKRIEKMDCPECKKKMDKPTLDAPYWWCSGCGHEKPDQSNRIES